MAKEEAEKNKAAIEVIKSLATRVTRFSIKEFHCALFNHVCQA